MKKRLPENGALGIVNRFFPKVTTVVDATEPALVKVTPKDASSKGIKDHNGCAMAVACKRKFHLDGVVISRSTAYLVKGKQARRFMLSEGASREVVSFDRGAGFSPGTYLLSAVSPARRLGSRTGGTKVSRTGKGAPKKFRHLTARVRSVLGGQQAED